MDEQRYSILKSHILALYCLCGTTIVLFGCTFMMIIAAKVGY